MKETTGREALGREDGRRRSWGEEDDGGVVMSDCPSSCPGG